MKKIFALLSLCSAISIAAQWSLTSMKGIDVKQSKSKRFYELNLDLIRNQLSQAQETGKNSKPIIINLPTVDGKMEQFEVYSLPVVQKSLAERYQLGSYVGAKVGDPTVWVRFSVSPYDLQSMIFKDGKYEFIEPLNQEKTVYGVFPKSEKQNGEYAFSCSTNESEISKNQINQLTKGADFSNTLIDFSKSSDKKYRTYRLAISTIGEYTQYFGGVPQAFAAINATVTRVNGVFEKDFAIHLNVQDFPQLIYTSPSTDPYSNANVGIGGAWNLELQQTLTSVIGNNAYDIGHLFGRAGSSGNAGGVGNVCKNPSNDNDAQSKGAAFSTPRGAGPEGENFDIDVVAHEMGHQFGADHTYSFNVQAAPNQTAHMEPGSGSTIMSYAGISGMVNVQGYSDSYFHVRSVEQVQAYVNAQTCGTATNITNNPPVVSALQNKTIPKGTAFVLTASAIDAENDPLTYSWEEYDLAAAPVNTVMDNNTNGAKFRSLPPSGLPYRYFPKLNTVIGGSVSNAADWESVSNVARTMNFKVLVRDNNPDVKQQQTVSASQTITVGNDGPFLMTTSKVYNNVMSPITWDVVNTNLPPYNVTNIKIDYSKNQGATWFTLIASTPNDGSEALDFAAIDTDSQIIVRVSAVDNVFYALGKVSVARVSACDGSAPTNLMSNDISQTSANIDWDLVANAIYTLRYKKSTDNNWTVVNNISTNHYALSQLTVNTSYEVNVASVCGGNVGTYTTASFYTAAFNYCSASSTYLSSEKLSNVMFADINNNSTSNAGYEDFSNVIGNVTAGQIYNFVASSTTGSSESDQVIVWIDINQDGDFDDDGEKVLTSSYKNSPWNGVITIPTSIKPGRTKMRVRLYNVISSPNTTSCGTSFYGQVEDYTLNIGQLAIAEVDKISIKYYPNPVADVLTISSDKKVSKISVYSTSGQLLNEIDHSNVINLGHLPSGVYFVKTVVDSQTETTKVIKK